MEQLTNCRTLTKDFGSTISLFNMKFEQHTTCQQSLRDSQRNEQIEAQPTVKKSPLYQACNRSLSKKSLLKQQPDPQIQFQRNRHANSFHLRQTILKRQNKNLKQQNQMLLQQVSKLKAKKDKLRAKCAIKKEQLQQIKKQFDHENKRRNDQIKDILVRLQILEKKANKRKPK